MKRIIIDTDPGIDDAMAILLLNKCEDILIEGITTVDGNVSIEDVTRNACFLLELIVRQDIKVYKGSAQPLGGDKERGGHVHGNDGLGGKSSQPKNKKEEDENAVDFLIRFVNDNPGEITILTLGPLTNIAKAVQKDRDFVKNVKQLVCMGGAEKGGNMTPQAEFNFGHDPEAAKIVFDAGFAPIVMVGLDVSDKVFFSPNERELLNQISTLESRFIFDISRKYLDFWFNRNHTLGFELCDPLAAMYLVHPELYKLTESFVDIETNGLCAGCSLVYRKQIYKDLNVNALVATDIKVKKFLKKFLCIQFPKYKNDINKLLKREYKGNNS